MPSLALPPSDPQIERLAHEILARERYRAFRIESYDFVKQLLDALRDLLSGISDLYVHKPVLYWALVIGLGVVCALLITHMVLTFSRALSPEADATASTEPTREADLAAEARALAARGDHLEAAHRLLLASLRQLARARVIPLRPEDGNARVCRQLGASALPSDLRAQLIELIMQTERSWFGHWQAAQPESLSLYRRWCDVHRELSRFTA